MVLLAQELLEEQLAKNDYQQNKLMPGLWTHHTRLIQFCLIMDDFGIEYVEKEHAEHLKQSFEQTYEITTD